MDKLVRITLCTQCDRNGQERKGTADQNGYDGHDKSAAPIPLINPTDFIVCGDAKTILGSSPTSFSAFFRSLFSLNGTME